jgi:hypothetical protein
LKPGPLRIYNSDSIKPLRPNDKRFLISKGK